MVTLALTEASNEGGIKITIFDQYLALSRKMIQYRIGHSYYGMKIGKMS